MSKVRFEERTGAWLDEECYTVNGIKMVYMKNRESLFDDYVATYNLGVLKVSQLELMGYAVVPPKTVRKQVNNREVRYYEAEQ